MRRVSTRREHAMSKHTREAEIPAQLLAEALAQIDQGRVLVYGGHEQVVATILARAEHILVVEPSMVMLSQAQNTFAKSGKIEFLAGVALPSAQFGTFDMVVIEAPQSRTLARRWLLEAHAALRKGGELYLGGLNDGGVRSLIDDAIELFDDTYTMVSKRRGRVARAYKGDHRPVPAWATALGVAPGTWQRFETGLDDGPSIMESLPGVFSYDRLDVATRLLLENIGDVRGKSVLDIGCGYGVIGLTLAQRGAANVDMLDENLYAVASTRHNAELHRMPNIHVAAADVRDSPFSGPYDLVVTNPPFHRGKQIDYSTPNAFIAYARSVLAPSGRLVLVANNFLRYNTVMREHFGHVEPIAQTPSFTLWQAAKVKVDSR